MVGTKQEDMWIQLAPGIRVFLPAGRVQDEERRKRRGEVNSKSREIGSCLQSSASAVHRLLISGLGSKEGTDQSKVRLVYRT